MPFSSIVRKWLRSCFIFPVLFLAAAPARAQLKADFTADRTGGCSPLTVSFTNTTTGASPAATYKWDFGNTRSSTLINPGTTYLAEQTYTVTLTAKDGLQISTKSLTITVYKTPAVDFSVSPDHGCLPLPVQFSSSSAPGDGTIANYFWDFGDGSTQQGSGAGQISHTYNFAQNASVSLTITNSYGCYNTLQKSAVTISPAVKAAFSADKTVLCQTTGAVQFTNTGIGAGTLSWLWDFGDGNTSTDKNPSHVFNNKGVYTIRLTVSSPGGCTDISTATNYIHVADFTTDFTVPSPACRGKQAVFPDKSIPAANSGTWRFDDGGYSYTYGGGAAYHYFNTTGQHTVTLTNTYGTCQQSVSKQVTINDVPDPKGFIVELNGSCGAPVTASFRDTASTAVQWQWNFDQQAGNSATSGLQAPSYTYTAEGYYTVLLTVTNAAGCSSSTSKPVNTYKPVVFLSYGNSTSASGNTGCSPFSMTFTASSNNDPITSYAWDFGDGGSSTAPQPVHTFSTPGIYIVHLAYTTRNGCRGTAEYSAVHLYQKPVADFAVLPGTAICGNNPVFFVDRSQGPVTSWRWNFGDSYNDNYSSNPTYHYFDDGEYTITLIISNNICSDTLVRKDYVKVLPPFPKITGTTNTCEGTRGMVIFAQQSKKATGWNWDFGDGSPVLSLNTDQVPVQHTYPKTGTYKVVLTTTNGLCSVRDSIYTYVLLKQTPLLRADRTEICTSDALNATVSNLDLIPFPPYSYNYYEYTFKSWQYGDLSPFTGSNYPQGVYFGSNSYTGALQGLTNGESNLRVILQSAYFGCLDTSNYIPLKIKGPVAAYTVTGDKVCYKLPVTLQDASYGTNNVPIRTWAWDYGNGQTEKFSRGGVFTHVYPDPGYYHPILTVTDTEGCTASSPYSYANYVQVNGPKAGFSYSPYAVSPNTTVYFFNNTNNTGSYDTQYQWWFGDGAGSPYSYPSHTYTNIGTDTVKLIARSASTGCVDTATQVIQVKTIHTSFRFATSYINNNSCPPVVVRFSNTSVNANTISWDFGDGSSADNQNYPSHTYYRPGVYRIILYGRGNNGARDSTVDSITVKGPYAALQADTLSGCTGQTVTLSAIVRNASSLTWDFGDGTLAETRDTFAVHHYQTGGLYTPGLIMKDLNGCSATSSLPRQIIIDSLNIAVKNMPAHVCNSTPLTLEPAIVSLASDQLQQSLQYKWDFGTGVAGDTSNTISATFTYHRTGEYPVTLRVASPYGCTKQITGRLLVVAPEPFRIQLAADTFACPGLPIQLQAAGAASYNWINAAGLNNSRLADPVAMPPLQPAYTVVGYDRYQCFTDTATVRISIAPVPTVTAGPGHNIQLLTGSTLDLSATGSSDVTQWNWLPPDYLNCTDCVSPVSTPRSSIRYIATVKNQYGCAASDTVSIKLICDQSRVYITNSITPNGDGKNDVFYIKGRGVRIIKYLRIFNRWGEIIFERSNFNIDDRSAGWDGLFKGRPVEMGTYVYLTELVCDSGETFSLKGTLVVIR